jgi:hypothetical protein
MDRSGFSPLAACSISPAQSGHQYASSRFQRPAPPFVQYSQQFLTGFLSSGEVGGLKSGHVLRSHVTSRGLPGPRCKHASLPQGITAWISVIKYYKKHSSVGYQSTTAAGQLHTGQQAAGSAAVHNIVTCSHTITLR